MGIGIGVGLGLSARVPSVPIVVTYTTEYTALLNQATSLGYSTPSSTQRIQQDILISNLKSDGLWDKLDLLYILATDGSSQFSTLNWINPNANQLNLVNSPTFTPNLGFSGNGSSAYLDPGWNITLATKASQNSISHGVLTNSVNPNVNVGYHGGGSNPYNIINTWAEGNYDGFYANGGGINITRKVSSFRAVSRTASNNVVTYQDANIDSSPFTTFPSSAPSAGPIYIMARGVPAPQWHAPSEIYFKADFWGAGLTQAEMDLLRTRLTDYVNSL
jgi:hypothetical protein